MILFDSLCNPRVPIQVVHLPGGDVIDDVDVERSLFPVAKVRGDGGDDDEEEFDGDGNVVQLLLVSGAQVLEAEHGRYADDADDQIGEVCFGEVLDDVAARLCS